MQDAQPQELETCAAIHLAIEKLEAIDMAFNLAAAPTRGERGTHRVQVGPEACCKAAQLGDNDLATD